VKQGEWRAKFGLGESTTLMAEKALRFEDNMTQSEAEGNECDDPEATMGMNERVKG